MIRHETRLLKTQTRADFEHALCVATDFLHQDEIIGVPTETVYGLAGNAFSKIAIKKIFAVKKRPIGNPLIVHIADEKMLFQCVENWDFETQKLASAFWPGPLTMVVERSKALPDEVVSGGDTVAIRFPKHPFMLAMISAFGKPLAAPSANRSNSLSPTQAVHVLAQLEGSIPLIIDGGPSSIGIESTVVDMTCRPARILRPGMISPKRLQSACEDLKWDFSQRDFREDAMIKKVVKSPGMSRKHYAPRAKVIVAKWFDESGFEDLIFKEGVAPFRVSVLAYERIPKAKGLARISILPPQPEAYARRFFAELFLCDVAKSEVIFVEAPPESLDWMGISDRLQRATGK